MPDLSKDFDKEYASWRRAKRLEMCLFAIRIFATLAAIVFVAWFWLYVAIGFFLTPF